MKNLVLKPTLIRKSILGIALLLTIAAAIWVEQEDQESIDETQPALPVKNASKSSAQRKEINSPPISPIGQRKFNAEADDIFAAMSWEPKRTPIGGDRSLFGAASDEEGSEDPFTAMIKQRAKSKPEPAPAPVAPPLQFKYLGKIIEGKVTRVFLSLADKNHVVGVGERIDSQYRVDRISDDTIEFTYMPLRIKQTLAINQQSGKL